MNKPYAVVRFPCLPEDEGRTFLIKTYETREEVEAWIEKQEGEYFSPGDYGIMKEAS